MHTSTTVTPPILHPGVPLACALPGAAAAGHSADSESSFQFSGKLPPGIALPGHDELGRAKLSSLN